MFNDNSSSDDELDEMLLQLIILRRRRLRKRTAVNKTRKTPRFWVRNIFQERESLGEYHRFVDELRRCDREYFFKYFRMTPERFQHLLGLVRVYIEKEDTKFRKAIPAAERLAITLRYLATGDSQQSLSFSFRVGKATISKIVAETSDAVYNVLKENYLSPPKTKEEWLKIAQDFKEKWNMPNTIGCIDGKHVRMECPKLSGTLYYNYKGFYSMVLMAVCDANYCFTLIDIGQYGSNNDSGVLVASKMGELFDDDKMNLPPKSSISESYDCELPYFLLGDEIFPLKPWLMRPYPGKNANEEERIYNYRHSRARRCIENAFGILSARWRIFQRPIRATVEHVESYTLACLALHNYLRLTNNGSYSAGGFTDSEDSSGYIVPGEWRSLHGRNNAFEDLPSVRGSRIAKDALEIRSELRKYLNSEDGSLLWQWDYIRRTSHYAV